jgi:hypothetical protein
MLSRKCLLHHTRRAYGCLKSPIFCDLVGWEVERRLRAIKRSGRSRWIRGSEVEGAAFEVLGAVSSVMRWWDRSSG